MEIECMLLHPSETDQAGFYIGPEAFYAIDVTVLIGKFVFSVLHSVVFLVTKVDKAIVATPAVRVNHAFRVNPATDNSL